MRLPHAPQAGSQTSGEGGPLAFPARGEPTENDFSSLAIASGLRLRTTSFCLWVPFLRIGQSNSPSVWAFREPARSFRKPRTIPHPEPGDGEPQEPRAEGDPQEPRTLRRQPWVKPQARAPGAQAMWDAWTKTAEDWLLERAGIGQGEGPLQGPRHGAHR